jgi:very-short-patch-repair endonuclease
LAALEAKTGGLAMYHHQRALIVDRAKDLRKRETEAEAVLWEELRKRKLGGCKIRRQHPFGSYIADFYCSERKLVIEIDGGIHDGEQVKEYDEIRQKAIEFYGIRVIRFRNEDVLNRMEFVLAEIEKNFTNKDCQPSILLPPW